MIALPVHGRTAALDKQHGCTDTLGFSHVMGTVGKDGQLDFVSVTFGGAQMMFSRAPGGPVTPRAAKQPVEIYIQVDDVERCHEQVTKRGVKVRDPLTVQWWGDRTFKVLDPNGYQIWFYTNVAEVKPPKGSKLV